MIVEVLTTCHTQYTWGRSIGIFLFNRTTLQVFVTYLTRALYVHPFWFYKHSRTPNERLSDLLHLLLCHRRPTSACPFTHAPCLLKLCIPPSNGIFRRWLFPEFGAEMSLDNYKWPTFMEYKHTKRLLIAVRRHLSKLRSKRRNA